MSKTTMVLFSSDNVMFEIDELIAMESDILKNSIELGFVGALPLHLTSKILSKVIDFCNKHVELAHEDLKAFYSEFVKLDCTTLIDLIHAAYELQIKRILDLTCKTVVDMITGKTAEEIREIFNMKNDFTFEEMEEIRIDDPWGLSNSCQPQVFMAAV